MLARMSEIDLCRLYENRTGRNRYLERTQRLSEIMK